MLKRLVTWVKSALIISLSASVLAGCGTPSVGSSYPLESITDQSGQTSRVYRAENKTVPDVARELAEQNQPQEISREDPDHMFLVYPDEWYHLQKDPENPTDTLIEVDNQAFVQNNYNPSFLEGYLLASIIDDLFDSVKRVPGNYRGYGNRDVYKPLTDYRTPTKQEKRAFPPITKEGSGSIIKRSTSSDSSVSKSGGGLFQKSDASLSKSSGKIVRNSEGSSYSTDTSSSKSKSSLFSRPRNNSPPKTKKGFGSLKRRR